MADATRTVRSVEKLISVDEDVITLTLSVDEAAVLRTILSRVHGDTDRSPRKHVFAIRDALVDGAGVMLHHSIGLNRLTSGEIEFANYPNGA